MQRRVSRDLGIWLLCELFWAGIVLAADGPPFPVGVQGQICYAIDRSNHLRRIEQKGHPCAI
jgi:hypothetical protein